MPKFNWTCPTCATLNESETDIPSNYEKEIIIRCSNLYCNKPEWKLIIKTAGLKKVENEAI
jgi:hypothetical protein